MIDKTEAARIRTAVEANPRQSLASLERSASGTSDPRMLFLLGLNYFRLKLYDKAASAFLKSAALDQKNATTRYYVGLCFERLGDTQAALREYMAANALNPSMQKAREKVIGLGAALSPLDHRPMVVPQADPPVVAAQGQVKGDSEESETALSRLLDDETTGRVPKDEQLAGAVLWEGRPSVLTLLGAAVAGAALVLLPRLLRMWVAEWPEGFPRYGAAGLWRILEAFSLPAALVIFIVALCRWATSRYVICEHRVEVTKGFVLRKHIVLWLHDLERPPIVRQLPFQLLVGTASVIFYTTALPGRGRLSIPGLVVGVANDLATWIRAHLLWQRRRMLKNFVSSR